MLRLFTSTVFCTLLCISPLIAQFSEDFETYDCNRNNAVLWSFSSFSLSTADAINGCSVRSSALSNPAGNYFLLSSDFNLTGSTSITFSYKVNNTSSSPSIQFILVDLATNQENVLWSSSVPSGNTVYTHTHNFSFSGNCKFKWKATGNQGASRMIIDNVISSANLQLPVELSSFRAVREASKAVLQWTTVSETNFEGFEVVEKVGDGDISLGYLPAKGPGTYDFQTENLSPGTHYFRLKMIDLDQSYEYSPVVSVAIPVQNQFSLEKVANGKYAVFFNKDLAVSSVQFDLFTLGGRAVVSRHFSQTADFHNNQLMLDLPSDLPTGIYFMRIRTGGHLMAARFFYE
ncbi:MAG: hypothetical protein H6577_15795 [Lewinellaceae bacterium]|nr:hypothetical protein [Saprospiraceae bacterium]MCB9339591.1 hypothetical protein [Lewinellaceae bacterium]